MPLPHSQAILTAGRRAGGYLANVAATVLLVLALAACAPGGSQTRDTPSPTSTTEPTAAYSPSPEGSVIKGRAVVDSVDVRILESFPVQVHATARGNLPDSCTTIGAVRLTPEGNTFRVAIETTRPADKACAEVLVPFEQNIPLEVRGLKAGKYTVDVNGVTETFELAVDNVAP